MPGVFGTHLPFPKTQWSLSVGEKNKNKLPPRPALALLIHNNINKRIAFAC
jgi:hypothetical protein